METTNANVKLTKKDILEIIDMITDNKNCQATIFIGEYGTTLTITPYEEHPDEWITVPVSTKVICPKCGRESDAMVPYCRWCGNENGINKDITKDVIEKEVKRNSRLRFNNYMDGMEKVKKNDQT